MNAPTATIAQAASGRWYWRIDDASGCMAVAPIHRHRATMEEAETDLLAVIDCELPDTPRCRELRRARAHDSESCYHRGRVHGRRLRRIWQVLALASWLALLAILLAGCGMTRLGQPPPLSVGPATGDGPRAATDQPILQSTDRIDGSAGQIDAAVKRYDVPALVAEVTPHTASICAETQVIRREAVALAEFANESAKEAHAATSGPRRIWAWLTMLGMACGAGGILAGLVLAIWAGRPRFGALTAVTGLAVLVTSYVLAAYIAWIIWIAVVMLLAAVGYGAWAARQNLYRDPPRKVQPSEPATVEVIP